MYRQRAAPHQAPGGGGARPEGTTAVKKLAVLARAIPLVKGIILRLEIVFR